MKLAVGDDNIKRHSTSVLLFIVFVLLGFFVYWVSSSLFEYRLLEVISSDFYSDKAITWTVNNGSISDFNELKNSLPEGSILYKPLNEKIRGAYAHDSDIFSLLYATGLDDETFAASKWAIVGQELRKDLIQSNGADYIEYENDRYRVVGITGIHVPSSLDYMLFISLDAAIALNGTDGLWVLDGRKDYSSVIDDWARNTNLNINKIDRPDFGTRRLYKSENTYSFLYVVIWLSFSICAATITHYWVHTKKQIIAIQKLCGFSFHQTLLSLLKCFCLQAIPGCLAGIIGAIFIPGIGQFGLRVIQSSSFACVLIAGVVACIFPLIIMLSMWTDRILRSC